MSPPPARRWTRVLAIIGTGLLTLVVTVLALLQLPPVATWAMRRLVTVVPLNPGYQLQVGAVSGDWLHRLVLDHVRLVRNGRELARIDRLRLGYDLRQLRGDETRLREVSVNGASISAHRQGDSWDLANALKHSADTTGGGGFRIERLTLRDVQLAAVLAPDSTVRVRGLTLDARDFVLGDKVLLKLDNLNAAVAAPGSDQWFAFATRGALTAEELRLDPLRIQTEATRIAGHLVLPRDRDNPRLVDRLDVELHATPLMLADLAAVVPSVTPEGALRFDASAEGDSAGLVTAHLGATLEDATATLDGLIPLAKSTGDYRLTGTVRRLDPSRLYHSAPVGSVNGQVEARLSGPKLPQADGRVELRLTPSRIAGRSVRRLDLRADLRHGSAGVTLRGNVEQGTLSATGRVRPFDSIPAYRLSGSATNLPGTAAVARGLTSDSGTTALDVRFQINGAGISPKQARLTGRVDLAALKQSGERTRLGHSSIALAGGRLDARPELLVGGGTISAHAIARLGDTVTYEVRRGTIDRVNLAQLTADTAIPPLSGEFALTGRGVSAAEAAVNARVTFKELSYAGRSVQQVNGRLGLAGGRASADFKGLLQGGRLTIEGSARPFDTTATFTLRRAAVDGADLGSFLGRPDLAGPVTLRATANGRWRGDVRSVTGQLTVEPSRLGKIRVSAGSVNATLQGDRLTYNGSLATNGGTFALEGDGHPLGGARSFAIRQGRADSLDLGTLLGRPDLRTAINVRFNADVAMPSADSTEARLALQLLPSRINQAQLTSGQMHLDSARRNRER